MSWDEIVAQYDASVCFSDNWVQFVWLSEDCEVEYASCVQRSDGGPSSDLPQPPEEWVMGGTSNSSQPLDYDSHAIIFYEIDGQQGRIDVLGHDEPDVLDTGILPNNDSIFGISDMDDTPLPGEFDPDAGDPLDPENPYNQECFFCDMNWGGTDDCATECASNCYMFLEGGSCEGGSENEEESEVDEPEFGASDLIDEGCPPCCPPILLC